MNNCRFLSSEQVASIFTTFVPATIREFAVEEKLPVAFWWGQEPFFERDVTTIQQILRVTNVYTK
jgi:hypothetical protein